MEEPHRQDAGGLDIARDDAPSCAERLKVLADPTRLEVIRQLFAEPCHVGELQRRLGIEQSLMSHHLRILREAGLVTSRRDGKSVLYRVAPDVAITSRGGEAIHLGCCVLSFEDRSGTSSERND